jgi:drug/metabolite transporter (DMT)-like permease
VPAGGWSWTTRTLFLVVVVGWGFNYVFVNIGLHDASPLWLATLRASVGAIAIFAIVTPMRAWGTLDRRGRLLALGLGVPNTAVFFGLWFVAAESVLPGFAAVVIYTFPLWVAVLSSPVLGRRLDREHWLSVTAGFVGVALIAQIWDATSGVTILPILELLGAALSWAGATVIFQRRYRREEMPEANAYQLIGGAVALLAATLVLAPQPLPHPGVVLWASVLWMGVLGTAVAYAVWFDLLGRMPAATLSAYVFVVPVVALAASVAFFGERLSVIQVAGVALVLLSIYGIGRARPSATDVAPSLGSTT